MQGRWGRVRLGATEFLHDPNSDEEQDGRADNGDYRGHDIRRRFDDLRRIRLRICRHCSDCQHRTEH